MKKYLPWLGLSAAAGAFIFPIHNPDLWWHLGAARFMAQEGRLPRADFLSHTMAGAPWLDFEWLAQLLYRAVFSAAGCGGLVALRALLMLLTVGAVLRLLRLHGAGPAGRGLAALLLAAALFPFADLRPDNFSLLFFAVLNLGLEARRLERIRLDCRVALAVVGLFALWADLHLGLVFGLVLAACYAAGEAAEALLPAVYGRGPAGPWLRCGDYLKVAALGVLGSLLNPYGWRLYAVAVHHARSLDLLQGVICEWMPPDLTRRWTWPYGGLLLLSLGGMLAHFIKTRRTPYALMIAVGYFGLASSAYQRHLSYFCLVAVPALFWTLRDLQSSDKPMRVLGWGAGVLAALLAAFLACYVWPFAFPLARGACPPAARGMAAFLAAEAGGIKGRRLYNSWADGGYLGLVLHPRYRVFFDGRYIFHPLLAEVRGAARSAAAWQGLMDRYGVDVACLKLSRKGSTVEAVPGKGGARTVVGRPYYVTYMPRKDWALVYWDADNLVLVRRARADPQWLRRNEYMFLAPDDQPFLAELLRQGRVPAARLREEMARHLRPSPLAVGDGDALFDSACRSLNR